MLKNLPQTEKQKNEGEHSDEKYIIMYTSKKVKQKNPVLPQEKMLLNKAAPASGNCLSAMPTQITVQAQEKCKNI